MTDGPHTPEAALGAAGATVETFTPKSPTRGRAFGRLRLLSLADAASAPPRHYLLKGLVAPGELSLWWGAPKCGKSFLLLRLGYGLAVGRRMFGRRAKPCRVLYVAAEGEGGFEGRLLALREALGDAGDAFQYIAQPTIVGLPGTDLSDLITAALKMRADMVVLDTLARTFGEGDENTAKDMGGFIAACDRLRAETGAHVAVIHHGRKDGGSSRGSGALLGAADLIVRVEKGAEGKPSRAIVEAAKDDADGDELAFRLRVIDLGRDEDGDQRSTCIAEEAEAGANSAKSLPALASAALGALTSLVFAEGQPVPSGDSMPLNTRGIREDRWREECEARRLSFAETQQSRSRVFRKAAQQLREAGQIATRGGWVWLLLPQSSADERHDAP